MKNIIKTIDYTQLKKNAELIRIMTKTSKLCAVVKSNAYGHGMIKVSKAIEKWVDYFGVNDINEALRLKKHVNRPVLILGACTHQLTPLIRNEIEISVSHIDELINIEKVAKKLGKCAKIHIALDTGMHRLGTSDETEINEMLKQFRQSKFLRLVGMFSHLGTGNDKERTSAQIEQFNHLSKNAPTNVTKHIFNSTFFHYNNIFDMARVGIGLYGYNFPYVTPAMTIKAKIVEIKTVKAGEFIGYGNLHKANFDTKIAIIAAGYSDGIQYRWKNGYVLYNDKKCPFMADICMNMSIIKATEKMKIGDWVTILGKCDKKFILATEIAKKCNTIEDEILVNF